MNTGNLLATEHHLPKLGLLGNLSPVWLVVIAAIIAMLPAMFYGVPSNIDLLNHFRFALPFYDAIQQGNLHPSWLAESNSGYGDTSFRFYPPALYYLLAIARAVSGSWYVGTMSVLVVLSVVGSLGVYYWARQFLPSESAMWAGILYSVAPYHTNQLYQAFLLAEFAGAALLPFGFAFVLRVCRRRSALDIAGLSLSFALLILTHLPLTVIGAVALVVYALICLERKNRWSTILRLTSAVLLALAASSFYWTTMLAELKWIRAYDSQSVEFSQNFLFKTLSPDNLNVWWMNIIFAGTLAMFWPAFVLLRHRKGQHTQQRTFNGVALLMFFSIFMATPISWPV
ncbi:MAG TPA: 6-pyruvoyl-tetrahydropterin synthase-related protein, partial [Pyrinomonadaceae bacterium]